jgi:glycosyltransferase involved in cell wall biosynthesis
VLNHALLVERPAVPEQPRERVVVFAASLEPRKAPSLGIRALAQSDPAVRLLVIGDGPERGSLERLAHRLGVRSRVTFAGRVSRQEVLRALSAAAAAVFTGVREEGGIALAEAMGAGTPTIVVAHGGARTIAEAATDRDRVIQISPGGVDRTVRALADAMSRLVLKPCLARDPLLDAQRGSAQLEEIASQVARHNWGTTPPPGRSRRALAVP